MKFDYPNKQSAPSLANLWYNQGGQEKQDRARWIF